MSVPSPSSELELSVFESLYKVVGPVLVVVRMQSPSPTMGTLLFLEQPDWKMMRWCANHFKVIRLLGLLLVELFGTVDIVRTTSHASHGL